jgi:hypothetical protein
MHCEEYADEYLGRDWYPALLFLTPSGQALEACVAPCDAKINWDILFGCPQ